MRRPAAALATVCLSLSVLTACGDDDTHAGAGSGDPVVIDVTFEGDTVEPNGDRVEVPAGEKFELHVDADAPGQIHVHSDPEQALSYEEGETTLKLTIDQPGVVEVESHDLEQVIVQLEVR